MAGTQSSRTPRCRHTSLTKPECHCPACLSEQMEAHRPRAEHGQGAITLDVGRAAA
jgi:hypothetical protein